jgi:hypothetical protein
MLISALKNLQSQKLDKVLLLIFGQFVRVLAPDVPRYSESVSSDSVSLESFFSSFTADSNA